MEKQPKSAQKSRHKVKNAGDRSRMLKMNKSSSKASPSKSPPQQIEIKPKDFICPSEAKQNLTEAFEEIKYQCATFKPGERSQFDAENDENPVDSDQYFSLAGTDAENSFEEEEEVGDSMEVADTTGETEEVVQLDKAELERKEFCSGDCVDQQPVSSEECFEEHQCVNKTEDTETLDATPNKLESSGETADMDLSDSTEAGRIEVCSGSYRMYQSSLLAEGDSTDSSFLINQPKPSWPDVSSSDDTYDSPTMLIPAALEMPVLLLETEDEDSFNAQPDLENQKKEEDDSKELSLQEKEIEGSVNQSQAKLKDPENIESCKENPDSEPDLKDLETEAKVESSLQINQGIPEKEDSCNEISDAQPDQKNYDNVVGGEESCQATLKIEEKESTGDEQSKTGPIAINPESETSLKGTLPIDMQFSKSCSQVCEPATTVSSLKRSLTTPSPRSVVAKTVTSTPEPQRGKIPKLITRCSNPKVRSHPDTPLPKSKLPRLTAKNKYNNVQAKVDSNLSGKKSSILKKQAVQEQPKELAVSWGKPIEQSIQQDSGEPELCLEMEILKEPEIEKLEEKQEEKVKEQDSKPEEQQAKEEKTAKMVMEVEKDPKALEDDRRWEVSLAELQAAPWPEEPLEPRLRHDAPDGKNNGKVLLGVAAIAVAGCAAYSNWDTIVKKSAALLAYVAPR
ncbi:Hypothetical predicted protein [Cloeon dipterum]|uniref:Uncharacterized protein n=1 Tax=Cloeon dipterum TaxID=197152 RepID=A0A8S1BU77_9INSE|nr:Hypothetical predicted protein [Cloeon dipterum]